jgi:hypothetical protein
MSQEDQTFRTRLHNAYFKLCKSHLVMRKDTSEGSLKFFEERLSEAMPRDAVERDQMRIIKDLYYNAPRLTYQVITADRDGMSKQSLYVLWTNAWCITRHFDIEGLVHLDWDAAQNTYHVRLPDPKPDQQDQGEKQVKAEQKPQNKPHHTRKPHMKFAETSDDWQTVDKKKYRPHTGKRNDRRAPKKPESTPEPEPSVEKVYTPNTVQEYQAAIDQSIKKSDPWD